MARPNRNPSQPPSRAPTLCAQTLGLLVAVLPLAVSGCRSPGNYLANRARDLGDCVRMQANLGMGLGASVKAAGLVHVGLGAGISGRHLGVGWDYGDGYAFGYGCDFEAWDTEADWSAIGIPISLIPIAAWSYAKFQETVHPAYRNICIHTGAEGPPGRCPECAREAKDTATPVPFSMHWSADADGEASVRPGRSDHACKGLLPALFSTVGDDAARPAAASDRNHRWLWDPDPDSARTRARVHAFDIEASVHALLVHVRAGISPGEILDFALGWVGVDIAADDLPPGGEGPGVEPPDDDPGDLGDRWTFPGRG